MRGGGTTRTLPKLNYEESEELRSHMMEIGRKWVSPPYCADGWRLDVAADLGHSEAFNHEFWKDFRRAVKEANPDAVILAEHYGDAYPWLRGDEWDTVMNYDAFMEPVSWFLTGMEKHSDGYREDLLGDQHSFVGAMTHHMCSFLYPSLQIAMNELSNHDHSRFLTRTNRRVGRGGSAGLPGRRGRGAQRGVQGGSDPADDVAGRPHHLLRRRGRACAALPTRTTAGRTRGGGRIWICWNSTGR